MSAREPGLLRAITAAVSAGVRACDRLAGRPIRARSELTRLAADQAALRQVATLVARGGSPAEVFALIAEVFGHVPGVDVRAMARFTGDRKVTVMSFAGWPDPSPQRQWPISPGTAIDLVLQTGRSARVDDYSGLQGPLVDSVRGQGVQSAVATPIRVNGHLWGVIYVGSTHGRLPVGTAQRMDEFTDLVATAIANAESREQLMASRARIVAASDETRRRIERDLHDGIQQRLVTLALELRSTKTAAQGSPELLARLCAIEAGLEEALREIREIARGVHPAILSEGGLRVALRQLARRAPMRVELELSDAGRLPPHVEAAAYYLVSEALTNAAKHAAASLVRVTVTLAASVLRVKVTDNGRGGADAAGGSGIVGLTDRVEALGGTLALHSPPGEGTTLIMEIGTAVNPGASGTVAAL